VLICAPFGRDAELISREITNAGMEAMPCATVAGVCATLREGAATAVIADEALRPDAVGMLEAELKNQPAWSDFPLIVMTCGGETTEGSRYRLRLLQPLGNITLLERPLRTATLVSSARSALRARRHQYQIATYLEQRAQTEKEIARRNEELTAANRQLEEFAYVASHDLQEPLRMVNTFTELLLRKCASTDAEAQRHAFFVHQGVGRMENLLRDLLAFSRTIAQDQVPSSGTADLSVCMEEAVAGLQRRIEETRADVTWPRLPVVHGEGAQLTLVFQNLLSNALKYRKADVPPKVEVSARRNGDDWQISIRDNGIGFDPRYSERIFGLFKRLFKDEYPGTGLGLAICQRIIQRYGGRIWAESEPGSGSVFHLVLHAAEPEA
jgi:signal transduction histidine kinase